MSSAFDISTEQGQLVIRVHPPGPDRETLAAVLDFLELEALRKRSALGEEQADALADDVKEAAWQRVRPLFEAGEQRA
jgi:hypothetical protein